MNTSLPARRSALEQLEAFRGRMSYPEFQGAAEVALRHLLETFPEGLWIDAFVETPLWLAGKRMVARGELSCAVGSNYFIGIPPVRRKWCSTDRVVRSEVLAYGPEA